MDTQKIRPLMTLVTIPLCTCLSVALLVRTLQSSSKNSANSIVRLPSCNPRHSVADALLAAAGSSFEFLHRHEQAHAAKSVSVVRSQFLSHCDCEGE